MKTKVWIFSAVIGLASLAAFESFSAAQSIFYYRTGDANPASCTPVGAACDGTGSFQCRVSVPAGIRLVYANTTCSAIVAHNSPEILQPQ